jgi:hypothetical protein
MSPSARTLRVAALVIVVCLQAACNGCLGEADGRSPAGPSTAEGTLVAFFLARKDGHRGSELWRDPVAGWPRITGPVLANPTGWEKVTAESEEQWSWFRYRIKSSREDGVQIEKLWDFCVLDTVRGPRIVAAWDAQDENVKNCAGANSWVKYRYGTTSKPMADGGS